MHDLQLWKRLLIGLGMLLGSLYLLAKSLETVEVTCAPDPAGVTSCHYEQRYVGLIYKSRTFTPTIGNITWARTGKNDQWGEVYIHVPEDKLTIARMTATEAEAVAQSLAKDPNFAIEKHGHRWMLVFVLLLLPVAIFMMLPDRTEHTPGTHAPPVEQSKKARRAERGRQRKAAAKQRR